MHEACCTTNSLFMQRGGLPYSGDYQGPEGFFELLMKIYKVLEPTPSPGMQYLVDDDKVVLYYRLTFTARASGESVEMSMAEVFTVHDGLIVELRRVLQEPVGGRSSAGGVATAFERLHGTAILLRGGGPNRCRYAAAVIDFQVVVSSRGLD